MYASQLESLPNELLVQILDYIDLRDVFLAFSNLNIRFNQLIRPFENLRLILTENNREPFDHCSPLADTLIFKDEISIRRKSLSNVRHVIIYCFCDGILTDINPRNVPFLEYISISNSILVKINLYKSFFAQKFVYLKCCNLSGSVPMQAKQSKSSFRCLKMGGIDLETYQCVLKACPNLVYLKFRMLKCDQRLSNRMETHKKLKELIIDVEISGWPLNDLVIERFFQLVPNIAQLNVYTSNFTSKIQETIIEYDWLASILAQRFVFLRQLFFFFRLKWSSITNQLKDRMILQQLQTNFVNVHCYNYQARLVIKTE